MSQANKKNIAIIGAGLAGLSAAYDLLNAGHSVTLYEASDHTGGLATGFQDDNWDWSLEHYYHHIFETDSDMISLVDELGISDTLFFPTPRTSMWWQGEIHPFSNPLDWFKFPGYSFVDFIRFGVVGAFLRFTRFWKKLEQTTADEWTRRWFGPRIYELTWKPLLINKFGPYYRDVNMAWLWARLHVRSFRLGYFKGGFQTVVDALTDAVADRGGHILFQSPVENVEQSDDGIVLTSNGQTTTFDRCLATVAPRLLSRITPSLPAGYHDKLNSLESMGAVVLVLALNKPLMAESETYWLNIPAVSPNKSENEIPFLAVVEHTNYIDKKHYGNDHIIYLGDYLPAEHDFMTRDSADIEAFYVAALRKINPNFDSSWVRASWLSRTRYAQPVPLVGHSKAVLPLQTALPALYSANMSQVYPWDRGTNFAVQIGRQAASRILEDVDGM